MANGLLSGNRQLCRLCLTDRDELYQIFGGEVADLAGKIYDCTRVEINDGDGMPALICLQCRAKVVVCQHFLGNCRKGDRKYRRLFEPQSRHYKFDEFRSKPTTLDVKPSPPNVHTEVVAKRAIPTKHTVLDRLKSDDLPLRRDSIEKDQKVDIQPVAIKRMSEDSHVANASMELLAIKIEQSIRNEIDQKEEVVGKRECPKCGLLVNNLLQHNHKENLCKQAKNPTVGKHVCGICNKTFTQRIHLKYHVNQHTGERPYKCSECDNTYANPTGLYKHKQVHSGVADYIRGQDQRYYCNVCHCVFKHRKLMHKHMRTNHRERQFPCETCGKAYFTKDYLNKHVKLVHRPTNK